MSLDKSVKGAYGSAAATAAMATRSMRKLDNLLPKGLKLYIVFQKFGHSGRLVHEGLAAVSTLAKNELANCRSSH